MAIEHIPIKDFAGTEQDVAVDVVGTDKYQIMKLMLGADGSATLLLAPGAAAASASIPVTHSTEDLAVHTAVKTALEIIDDWDASDHCNIRHLTATDDTVNANLSATDNAVLDAIAEGVRPAVIWTAFHNVAGGAHTDVALQAAPAGSLCLYVTDFIVTNDATLATTIFLEEDTASGKTAKTATYYVPKEGGFVLHFQTPIKLTANKDLGFTTTGTANTSVEVHGYTA